MRSERTVVLLVIVAIIAVSVLAIRSGALVDALSADCRRVGESLRVNWMWDPLKGCFIQQPNGSWVPVDNNRIYQP